ncbi:hypothetical protein AMATHDRAFT_60851 [Amanita thiersii Skay4041]|uniref:WW domain-containing protein n=1 Tax=Amanita thiersii Skay4041 TaxID=703135 RepID=A0A2A9NSA5_9AGAR|nr:hypothetical protein AMATHDRAFT_60851 [Amanita thiersii Skay4041]
MSSSPPPYDSNKNPDTRPLPPGWITQFDTNYKAWFYVNTVAQPPVTTWVHPLGPPPAPGAPAQTQYAAPSGPPPPSDNKQNETQPQSYNYGLQGGYGGPPYGGQQQYGGQPQYGGQYGGQYSQMGPAPPPASSQGHEKVSGGFLGKLFNKPGHGSSSSSNYANQGYAQAPPQMVQQMVPQQGYYQQKPPKKHGGGMGGAGMLAAGAGAGLLGGLLVADAIDDAGDFDGGFGDDMGGDW